MVNFDLYGKIEKANIELVDINGFKYNVAEITVANIKGFKALVPIFTSVSEGDYIYSSEWELTRGEEGINPDKLAVRFDNLSVIDESEYTPLDYFRCKCVGLYITSEKCTLRSVGPRKKPLYLATLKIKDEKEEPFTVLITAFNKVAESLINVPRLSILAVDVCIKNKKYKPGYELCVSEFKVK